MAIRDGIRSGHERENTIEGGSIGGAVMHQPSLPESGRTLSISSIKSNGRSRGLSEEKPLASGNGVYISISLAEPALYLQGFDQSDSSSGTTTMLRGALRLKVAKSTKIKSITLTFRGRAETEWPGGELEYS